MAVEALVTPLLSVPLFQGLSSLQLVRIARASERIVFRPGEVIIRAGDDGDAAYLVVSGEASRVNAPDEIDEEGPLAPCTLIGEMAMLIETEHSATIVTRSTVKAMRITRDMLHGQMTEDPSLAEHFLGKIVGRLTALARELERIEAGLAVAAASVDLVESSHLEAEESDGQPRAHAGVALLH